MQPNSKIMKRIVFILLLAITMTSLSSCRKSGVDLFVGDYSFKTSGEISLTAQTDSTIIPAVLNASIATDAGQLNIAVSDEESQEVIVVLNYMNGDVITTYGTCEGNRIELEEFQLNTLPVSINIMFTNNSYITVGGTGTMYDDNMIVFDMTLSGKGTIGSVTYKIRDKNVKMVAYRN